MPVLSTFVYECMCVFACVRSNCNIICVLYANTICALLHRVWGLKIQREVYVGEQCTYRIYPTGAYFGRFDDDARITEYAQEWLCCMFSGGGNIDALIRIFLNESSRIYHLHEHVCYLTLPNFTQILNWHILFSISIAFILITVLVWRWFALAYGTENVRYVSFCIWK